MVLLHRPHVIWFMQSIVTSLCCVCVCVWGGESGWGGEGVLRLLVIRVLGEYKWLIITKECFCFLKYVLDCRFLCVSQMSFYLPFETFFFLYIFSVCDKNLKQNES